MRAGVARRNAAAWRACRLADRRGSPITPHTEPGAGSGPGLAAIALCISLLAGCGPPGKADPGDAGQVATGKRVYEAHCLSCHGAKLEGQPRWRERLPNGRLPAPPHDATGHTWHHPDAVLFRIVKEGVANVVGGNYESDMPPYKGVLNDAQIWAVLAYIKSTWPEEIRRRQPRGDS